MVRNCSAGVTNPQLTSQKRQNETTCSIGGLFSSSFSTQKLNIQHSYSHKFSTNYCHSFRFFCLGYHNSSSSISSISHLKAIWNPINRNFVRISIGIYDEILDAVVTQNGHVICDMKSGCGKERSTKIWSPEEDTWITNPELNKQHKVFPSFTAEGYVLTYSQPNYCDLDLNPSANEEEQDAKFEELSQQSTLKIWDPTSWTCVHALNLPNRYIPSVAVTKQGHIVTMSEEYNKQIIEIWDLETKECLTAFLLDLYSVTEMFITPENLIVLCAPFNEIQIWDPQKKTCVHKIFVEEDSSKSLPIENALITQDGTLLVVYSEPGGPQKMKIFDPKTGEQLYEDFVPKADGQIFITPDGYFVLKEKQGEYQVRYFNRSCYLLNE